MTPLPAETRERIERIADQSTNQFHPMSEVGNELKRLIVAALTQLAEEERREREKDHECRECPNCKETKVTCACLRNTCTRCGFPVGNITFSVCDTCWDEAKPALRNNLPTNLLT